MFTKLLSPEIQAYIRENDNQSVSELAFKKNPFPEVAWADILNQLSNRQKAKYKLPTWYAAENIIYPSKLSVEQTSSETAAAYKATLVSGEDLIDLTGGFGIDDYYFSKNVKSVTHCELNEELSLIAKHNFEVLCTDNISCIPGDSLNVLKILNNNWEWIYADPARRNDDKGKVFMLRDCLPNVPDLLDTYFKYTKKIIIKTAPLLDISAGIAELYFVKEIHITAISNEVKELLWVLEKGYSGMAQIVTVNIRTKSVDRFVTNYQNNCKATYSLPKQYLYEPNSAIMKSGAFDAVSDFYKIDKLHKNSHLYTSDLLIDFPGRRFVITKLIPYQKSEIKKHIEGKKMNVTVRNFPLHVSDIRKKWKIIDGGEIYAFFTITQNDEKVILLCTKV